MMAPTQTSLYDRAVKITEAYLGPAGERFLRRQISTHIGVEPEKLRKQDIPILVNWSGLAFALLTNDAQEIEGFTANLMALSGKK
jgi:hypothetical protein